MFHAGLWALAFPKKWGLVGYYEDKLYSCETNTQHHTNMNSAAHKDFDEIGTKCVTRWVV